MNMVRGACIAVAVAAALGAHAADPEGFGAKQTITFSGYDGATSLENFPALIKLPTMNFRSLDYKDLVVTDADGNILPHEVDSVMDGKVLVWVRVPYAFRDGDIGDRLVWKGRCDAVGVVAPIGGDRARQFGSLSLGNGLILLIG